MKKINNWVIRTFGLRGSWSWAKKQMLSGKELPVDKFYKNKSQKDGFGYYCKDCVNAYKSSKKPMQMGGVN